MRMYKVHSPEAKTHEKTDLIIELQNASFLPTLYEHITKGLFPGSYFYLIYIIHDYQEKYYIINWKAETQFEERDQVSEPNLDMAWVLELSDWKFKTTMIYMLSVLMDKVDHMQEQIGNVSRQMEPKKKCKINTRICKTL